MKLTEAIIELAYLTDESVLLTTIPWYYELHAIEMFAYTDIDSELNELYSEFECYKGNAKTLGEYLKEAGITLDYAAYYADMNDYKGE